VDNNAEIKKEDSEELKLNTVDGGGVLPGADLDNSAALLDRMEGLDDCKTNP
jgi:hypothetical protein